MTIYQGMRWFKCDFQIQSPEDAMHWADSDTKLDEPRRPLSQPLPDANGNLGPKVPDESRIQEIARTFLRRCHTVGLEVIGVTDHNFSQKIEPRDWFLTHLIEQNKVVAQEFNRPPLFILPGFEVDIGYHVLCLFEPAKKCSHVRRVNMILTKLGLIENQRFRAGVPEPLRSAGENVSLKKLLEVVQNEHGGIVIAAHADQNDGIMSQARNSADYQLLNLMAVEVTANPPAHKYLDILEGRNNHWSRTERQPAYVMSSDAKSLKTDPTGNPCPNSVGYRHSWLKMSKPSIEAMRQAFLDPSSRVKVLGDRPSDSQKHPRICSISVRGAKFLDDQDVIFSENLNCVIGGRGSGKSSLLEYLRFAFGLDDAVSAGKDTSLARKRELLLGSITNQGAEIRVTFQAEGGVSDTLIFTPSNPVGQQRRLEGRQVDDLPTVLKQLQAQFFSQGELSRMTGNGAGQGQVLSLIDTSSGAGLIDLQIRERDLQARLNSLFQSRKDQQRLLTEIKVATQEATELERQMKARESVQADSIKNQMALQARRFLDELVKTAEQDKKHVAELIDSLSKTTTVLPETAKDWPESEWFNASVASRNSARIFLIQEMEKVLRRFNEELEKAKSIESINTVRNAVQIAQDNFKRACAEKGIQPEDITRLQGLEEQRQAKLELVLMRQKELEEVNIKVAGFDLTLSELHTVWREQFNIRSATAKAMENSVASHTVRVSTEYMADKSSFSDAWRRLAPRDGRNKLARHWEELGDDIFSTWQARQNLMSPWELVEIARSDVRAIPYFYGEMLSDLQPALIKHIDSDDVRPIWEAIRITRINDGVDVELLRDDGTPAGSMSGALSEGQRNTVLLNLMLARGVGPIVIDQPEDELDSSFIYKTLVKDLRAIKDRRQLIVATHNANLPVNGDAELIYALEARDGRGKQLGEGGLDRKEIAEAVLNIMEGSEQAFKRRSEKYHF